MLRVHEVVAVVRHAYPDKVPNGGERLSHNHFYYGLLPSLKDMLSFAMADLPERDQADTSFDTLYHLAKKMEACHQSCSTMKGGAQAMSPTKATRSTTTVEAELFPPDLELVESTPLDPDHLEGLILRMTQAMNHFQREQQHCFMCGDSNPFMQECPIMKLSALGTSSI